MSQTIPNSRKHLRFDLDFGSVAEIDLGIDKSEFICHLHGLIINDSFGGCELLVVTNQTLKPHNIFGIKFAGLGPFQARIVWVEKLEEHIFKLGVEYLD